MSRMILPGMKIMIIMKMSQIQVKIVKGNLGEEEIIIVIMLKMILI